tara:strand:+ start:4335 stop:4649 length:315 start_codon:yes stop_codon:yes gene_type:complete
MSEQVKFTDEELQKLGAVQTSYQNLQSGFGQLRVQRILLEQQMSGLEEAELNLEEEYTKAQDNERTFVKELNEKYGPGTLDPTTGVFTPAPTPTATEEATGAPK